MGLLQKVLKEGRLIVYLSCPATSKSDTYIPGFTVLSMVPQNIFYHYEHISYSAELGAYQS